ncbi:MAG: ubiquinol-cytochrome C reductase [Gemmatimonadetes bacterium 13_1_40CM_70_11]|nr:MAG: ubiquinol-cytochrome C reductase [Gemmatimonadetes bacterium 13_1_40CM_70_11]
MPSYWILKTEPSAYSFDRLERERSAVWDGVKNPLALKHLRAMQPGDEVMIYHTGDEKAVVGTATVATGSYPDPKAKDPALVVVDLKAGKRLPQPVPLSVIKADPVFKDIALVRMPRLSVVPATAVHWSRLLGLSGGRGEGGKRG